MSERGEGAVGAFAAVATIGLLIDVLAAAALFSIIGPVFAVAFGVAFYGGLLLTLIYAGSWVLAFFTKSSMLERVADFLHPAAEAFMMFMGLILYFFGVVMAGLILFWGGLVLLEKM